MRTYIRNMVAAGAMSFAAMGVSVAQTDAEAMNNLAALGGVMQAAAQSCGYTDAQLRNLKADQQKALTDSGMSSTDFEAAFGAGVQRGQQAIANANADQKKQMCDELEASGAR